MVVAVADSASASPRLAEISVAQLLFPFAVSSPSVSFPVLKTLLVLAASKLAVFLLVVWTLEAKIT